MNWISLNSMIRKWFRRKPLNVSEGGTGANISDKACENLGAVKKTGDIISGNLEFYGEKDGKSFVYPVVNAKVSENGIDAIIGGSEKDSSLTIGSGEWANNLVSEKGDLNLVANNSIRLFQKRTKQINENESEEYLAERWRFNTNGYLQHINAYDLREYYPFSCRRTYIDTEEKVQKDALAGGLRITSSFNPGSGQTFVQGKDNTLFGIQGADANNTNNSNYLFLGALTNSKNASQKVVSFRPGLTGSSTNDSIGKADAEAWRAALISDKGYGLSGNDSNTIASWRKWLSIETPEIPEIPSWTILKNTINGGSSSSTFVPSSTGSNVKVAEYLIGDSVKEILFYCRSSSSPYNYGSTLLLSRPIILSLSTAKVFTLGGGWNNTFTGDAARIKLSYNTTSKKLLLYVNGVSVNNEWISSSWFCYWK